MDSLYNQTNKLIQHTQQQFHVLKGNALNASDIEAEVAGNIELISRNCEKLDTYIFKLPVEHRQNAKMRNEQLKYDNKHLKAALEAAKQKRIRREQALTEREQLLNKRYSPNPDLTTINIEYSLQHQNSLHNANNGIEEMLYTGANTLESLRSQRISLKEARKRIISMGNTLGLSNHTMRLIEKRIFGDKVVFFSGVVVTIIVIILVISYFT